MKYETDEQVEPINLDDYEGAELEYMTEVKKRQERGARRDKEIAAQDDRPPVEFK